MKKTMAYAAAAILLGFAIMMLPLALEAGPPTYTPQLQPGFPQFTKTNGVETQAANGLVSQPMNLLPSSLVFISGLIVALGVYAILKRRVT